MKTKLLVVLLLAIIVANAAYVAPAPVKAAEANCAPDIGKKLPVVLVHGLWSSKSLWGDPERDYTTNSMASAINHLLPAYVVLFDYSEVNSEWVDNPAIGPRLARTISCLAAASRAAGGPGKVVAIGHSMGGLAIRYASGVKVDGRRVSLDIGMVATIGTPNLGSLLANVGADPLRWFCKPWQTVTHFSPDSPCDLLALQGLAKWSDQLAKLDWLPSNIPVYAFAGDLTIHYGYFYALHTFDTDSDFVVGKKSALWGNAHPEQGGGAKTLSCDIRADLFDAEIGGAAGTLNLPTCLHTVLPHNQDVILGTVNAIKKYMSSLTYVSYIGKWYAHHYSMTINADLTGTDVNTWVGPCDGVVSLDTWYPCSAYGDITFVLQKDGSLLGTYTKVRWIDDYGQEWPLLPDVTQPGDTFKLVHAHNPQLLCMTSPRYAPDDGLYLFTADYDGPYYWDGCML
jgi:pimeloyl-ACP methyl ester carboxylesterase